VAGGCAQRDPNRSGLLQPYRTDLPQGNYLTQQTLDQVKEGMTREQVRFALGTPLLRHVFHPDRWDYVFRYQFPNGRAELRRATIAFPDDRVAAIEAESLPAKEDPADPALPGYRPPSTAPKAQPGCGSRPRTLQDARGRCWSRRCSTLPTRNSSARSTWPAAPRPGAMPATSSGARPASRSPTTSTPGSPTRSS